MPTQDAIIAIERTDSTLLGIDGLDTTSKAIIVIALLACSSTQAITRIEDKGLPVSRAQIALDVVVQPYHRGAGRVADIGQAI
ncbi:hypothetical protein D3C73_990280 [compost metagenome]